jgi:hypothetical protein
MGISCMSRSFSSYENCSSTPQPIKDGNPDPNNYTITDIHETAKGCVMLIIYPDCDNYEGRKILLFNKSSNEVKAQGVIDPHFSNNEKYISPIARFVPNKDGWEMAINTLTDMEKK